MRRSLRIETPAAQGYSRLDEFLSCMGSADGELLGRSTLRRRDMTARTTGASLNQQARLPVQRRTTDLIGAIRMAAPELRTLASFGGLFTGVPEDDPRAPIPGSPGSEQRIPKVSATTAGRQGRDRKAAREAGLPRA